MLRNSANNINDTTGGRKAARAPREVLRQDLVSAGEIRASGLYPINICQFKSCGSPARTFERQERVLLRPEMVWNASDLGCSVVVVLAAGRAGEVWVEDEGKTDFCAQWNQLRGRRNNGLHRPCLYVSYPSNGRASADREIGKESRKAGRLFRIRKEVPSVSLPRPSQRQRGLRGYNVLW